MTDNIKEKIMTQLPAHLQKVVNNHEAKLEEFGIKPMYKILEEQKENMDNNPDHVLHAYVAG